MINTPDGNKGVVWVVLQLILNNTVYKKMKRWMWLGSIVWVGLSLMGCESKQHGLGIVVEAKIEADANAIPDRLSQWPLFMVNNQTITLRSNGRVYDLQTPLFSDYALKLRAILVPEGQVMRILDTDKGVITLPEGSVISKTFYYPKNTQMVKNANISVTEIDKSQFQLLETRLLVRTDQGYQALVYVWNDQQTDAILEWAGASITLRDFQGQHFNYHVPNVNQCRQCHGETQLQPIGLNASYFDGAHYLNNWVQQEVLSISAKELEVWKKRKYLGFTVSEQARHYLDINCGHCHNASGAAVNSGLYLNRTVTDSYKLGICKPPIAAGRGSGGRKYALVPQDPEQSILLFRMRNNELDVKMPELGRNVVHQEGVELIKRWILSLTGKCE